MLILAALVLATTIAETPCDQSFSEVLRTELAVFLEPSDSNRKKSTKRIIKTLLVPLHDDLVHASCAKAIACALADFGTPRLVDRALKAESEFYRSVAWGPRTNRGIPDPTATLADTRDLLILSDELAGCAKRSVREVPIQGIGKHRQ